jgi:hypothetical protein
MTEVESTEMRHEALAKMERDRPRFTTNQVVWALITAAMLVYLLVLPIRIQFWAPNLFTNTMQELRRWEPVRHIWGYQIRHLPVLGSQLIVQVLFTFSILVVLAAFFYALWLVLNQEPDDERPEVVDVV